MNEFQFLDNLKSKYSLEKVGDDCAVLPKDAETDMLVTADMLVEDVDFRVDWTTPEFLGHKALTVSLSDIAAMGGMPKWAMLSIAVPEQLWKSDFLDRFYKGWHKNARRSGTELIGGDISRTEGKLTIDSIVFGEVPAGKAILRSGAQIGDAIVVTDRIGGSGGGLRLLESGHDPKVEDEPWKEVLISIHLQPWPQTGTGYYLRTNNLANAMIDISDGLLADLMHLCTSSRVGAELIAEKIPVNLNLRNLFPSFDEEVDFALSSGDDYQLLFTLPQSQVSKLSENMIDGRDYGLFHVIGEVTANTGVIELIRNGKKEKLEPKGYRHF